MSNTNKPMTAKQILKPWTRTGAKELFSYVYTHNAITAMHDYAAQQTAELRKQLAEKEAEIKRLKYSLFKPSKAPSTWKCSTCGADDIDYCLCVKIF